MRDRLEIVVDEYKAKKKKKVLITSFHFTHHTIQELKHTNGVIYPTRVSMFELKLSLVSRSYRELLINCRE